MLVKTCGIQTYEAAKVAIYNNTTFIGIIQVPNRKRTLDDLSIIESIHSDILSKRKCGKKTGSFNWEQFIDENLKISDNNEGINYTDRYLKISKQLESHGPFLVGVFRNQSIEEIENLLQLNENLGGGDDRLIDIIQLHGNENKKDYVTHFASKWKIPVITRYLVNDLSQEKGSILQQFNKYLPLMILLDSDSGGDGKTLDWDLINELNESNESIPVMLAGGLNCENVKQAKKTITNLIGVDVSSGIETDGVKDLEKIKLFIKNSKL